ncbi:MAG: hypothetical protein KME13_21195 [Myxacorys californica WJT36-NPBG1]|nr:hypothetical protein [Myxacorys californica WJT36-NPBG1]
MSVSTPKGSASAAIIDKLNDVIQGVAQSARVHYLDCRHATEPSWYDDMHPDRDGFLALAVKFEEAMNRL